MEHALLQEAADRIRRMEQCLDVLQEAANRNPAEICKDELKNVYLQNLVQYYESGQWLRDYELDEQGLLPQNLKRGVLAQDTLYNFLDLVLHKE